MSGPEKSKSGQDVKQAAAAYLSELLLVEMKCQHILDDASKELLAEVYVQGLITEAEWSQIKDWMQEALEFLRSYRNPSITDVDGRLWLDPDLDPRNADWLRTYVADKLSAHRLPPWAALWLWRLRTDTSPKFWRKVGHIADRLGCTKFQPEPAPPTHEIAFTHSFPDDSCKVGGMPVLPELPKAPYPYCRPYLFSDGTVEYADGFVQAMRLHVFETRGFARAVPFGVNIDTKSEKLWLLGRSDFAPGFAHHVNQLLAPGRPQDR